VGDPDNDDGPAVTSSDSGGCGEDALTPADSAAGARERRRRHKNITAATMEIADIPPTTPPTMAPVFELPPPCG
jgi:hypothetical protein